MYPLDNPSPLAGYTVPRGVSRRIEAVSEPAIYPISLGLLKGHLRVTDSSQEDYLTHLIATATDVVEKYLSRGLINRSVRMWMDGIPGYGVSFSEWFTGTIEASSCVMNGRSYSTFDLMGVPVDAVDAISYVTDDGTETEFSSDFYIVDNSDKNAYTRILLAPGASWPSGLRYAKSIVVDYDIGYGDAQGDIPASLRHGVMLVAAALWSDRGDNADPVDVLGLQGIKAVLDPYRLIRIGTKW